MTQHTLAQLVKKVNKTHKGLGPLIAMNLIAAKARKCILNVAPAGCGKSTATDIVYRMLRDMESKGCVTSTWDDEQTQGPPRRVYCLTAQGDQVLALWVQDLEQSRDKIDYLLAAYQRHMVEGRGEYHQA